MSSKIVILSGSPRKGGNTDALVDAFTGGAESAGKSVTTFRVADMQIGGCRGCGYCFEHKAECLQKDDMPQILKALQECDALVLASPVYYFGVTAQLKAAIDRTYALLFVGQTWTKAALLLTCGNGNPTVAEPSIAMYRAILDFQQKQNGGVILAKGLHAPGEIAGKAQLKQAEQLGKEI